MELIRNKYHNTELLNEYFSLQKEMSAIVFGQESKGKRIWDVYNYLSNLNDKKGGVATNQLKEFEKDCAFVSNTIAATLSGCRGERMAFKSLDTIKTKRMILKNVELDFDGHKTEIDAVVLTKKGAIIVEVKNTSRNVVISSSGNLKRQNVDGHYVTDCHLGLKMNDKEYVLRRALEKSDYKRVPIKSIVVFTNSEIVVDNQNEFIKSCSLSELPHVIEKMMNSEAGNYCVEEIKNMAEAVNKSRVVSSYSDSKELERIKNNFEKIMCLISAAPDHKSIFSKIKNFFVFAKKAAAAMY